MPDNLQYETIMIHPLKIDGLPKYLKANKNKELSDVAIYIHFIWNDLDSYTLAWSPYYINKV